jgi:DNA-binding transcriptional ArsR family regulator
MEIELAVQRLSALAQDGRLQVFRLLVRAGAEGLAAGEIARRLGVPPNTLSAQVTLLANAGLVRSRRIGRSIVYWADYQHMAVLLAYLMEDCCEGRPEVCAPLAGIAQRAACCAVPGRSDRSC